MADYKPGEMDISTQEAGFDAFIKFSTRVSVFVIVLLLLMYVFLT